MPPKDSKKTKVKDEKPAAPATPQKTKQVKSGTKDTPAKPKATPKKKDITIDFKPVIAQAPETGLIPITVTSESDNGHAIQKKSGAKYTQILKLEADNAFSIPKTIMLTEGPHAGHQAILLRPAKAFNFASLPDEARNRIYRFYFAPNGLLPAQIVLDGKRPSNKEVFAKTYAEGSKYRVALLAISKTIHREAADVFYGTHTLKLDSTATLVGFLGQITTPIRLRLTSVCVKTYHKPTARNALHFLAEAANLQTLKFENGVFAEVDPTKAAKAFHGDAYKFLEALGKKGGDMTAGVDILQFGKLALTVKGDAKKGWEESVVEEFKEKLRERMRGEL